MQSTYDELVKIVGPYVEHFKTDLTEHDCNILKAYDGPFIYGYRKSGTDLIKMRATVEEYEYSKNCPMDKFYELLREDIIWITGGGTRNTMFLYFDGKKLHRRTKEQVSNIYLSHVEKIINAAKCEVV
jgi:hypothetical protein